MPRRPGRPAGLIPDGEKIRELRVGLGLSRGQVAAQAGCHPESVTAAEGGRPVSDVLAVRLAKILGVTVAEIARPPDDSADGMPRAS